MRLRASECIAAATAALLALAGAALDAAAASSDWRLDCDDAIGCRIETFALREGRLAATLTVRPSDDGAFVGVMLLPLNLYIPSGVRAKVDQTAVEVSPQLLTCTDSGCLAGFKIDGDLLLAMRGGLAFDVRIVDSRSGGAISLRFSLRGFTVATRRLVAEERARLGRAASN